MRQYILAAVLALGGVPALAATVEYTATVKLTGILYIDDVRTNYVLDMPSPLVFTFEGEDSYDIDDGLTTISLAGIGTIDIGETGSGSYLADTITLDPGINADVALSVPDTSGLYQRSYTLSATGSFSRDYLMDMWPDEEAADAISQVFQPLIDDMPDMPRPDPRSPDVTIAPVPPSLLMMGTALVALYWRFRSGRSSA